MVLKLIRKLSKSGGSLVLRIPRDIENFLQLKPSQKVAIWIENNKIIIEPKI